MVRRIEWNAALDLWAGCEVLLLALVLAATTWLPPTWQPRSAEAGLLFGSAWLAIHGVLSWYRRSIDNQRPRSDALSPRLADWAKAGIGAVALGFAAGIDGQVPPGWVLLAMAAGGLAVLLLGVLYRAMMTWLADRGRLGQRIAIYGCNADTLALIRSIEARAGSRTRIDSLFDERARTGDDGSPERTFRRIGGMRVLHDLDELFARVRANRVSAVVIDLPWSAEVRIKEIVTRLEAVNVDVLMAPTPLQRRTGGGSMAYLGLTPTLALYRRPMVGLRAVIKRTLDIVLSGTALLLLAPLLALVAVAIRLDSPGPVLFRQKRRGMNNQPISIYKFRSMYTAATDANADKLVVAGDVRVTRLGAFIRRTSIDELPQLFNILKGDMSLVGPRPHAYAAKAADRLYEEVVTRYPARHRVHPGLTGLAQVRGYRGNTLHEADIVNRVESDLEYIDRWTVGMDLRIIARTAVAFLFQKGAY